MTSIQQTSQSSAVLGASSIDVGASTSSASRTLLPEPDTALALSGDPGAELAALMVKNGSEQRNIAQTSRDMDEKIQQQEDDAEVSAMRQKADDIRHAGWVQGAGMMAEGAASLVAARIDGNAAAGDAGTNARMGAAEVRATGTMLNATTVVGASAYTADGASHDADAAAHRSASERARSAADDMKDAKKAGDDLVSAALDFYRQYVSGQAAEQGAALHRT